MIGATWTSGSGTLCRVVSKGKDGRGDTIWGIKSSGGWPIYYVSDIFLKTRIRAKRRIAFKY